MAMLTLRRKVGNGQATNESTIDCINGDDIVTLSLVNIMLDLDGDQITVWKVSATDWGSNRFPPSKITLTNNQPLEINNWLKVFGSKVTEGGEAVMHLQAPKEVKINRRDRQA
jgi:hypothetical protein